jgi:hypothetical protein
MRVVFLLRRGESVTLGIDFLGPEGDSLSVWTATTEDRFTPVLRDYWYRSPL